MKRIISLICILTSCISLSAACLSVSAKNSASVGKSVSYSDAASSDDEYRAYLNKYENHSYGTTDITLSGSAFVSGGCVTAEDFSDENGEKKVGCLISQNDNSFAEYVCDIPQDGLYNFSLTYAPVNNNQNSLKISLMIDGSYPFKKAESIELSRYWFFDKELKKDDLGNEYSPSPKEAMAFSSTVVYDRAGILDEPYLFYLTAGRHTVKLNFGSEPIALASLGFTVPETVNDYESVQTEYSQKGYSAAVIDKPIAIEGESVALSNSFSVVPKSDINSPSVAPSDAVKQLINYIGGSNWQIVNDEVIWEFEVKESGLYCLGVNFKQDQNMNLYSYRHLKIDGKTPFKECTNIKFGYNTDWEFTVLGDAEPYTFYLEQGKHTVSLAVTLGETLTIYQQTKAVLDKLGDLYIDITMITGESPDSNRDYELHKQVPDFSDRLKEYRDSVKSVSDQMKGISGGETNSFVAALNDMTRVLDTMYEKPFKAQLYVPDYYTSYSTLTSWLYDMKAMPLSIDRMIFASADSNLHGEEVGFFEKLSFSVRRFVSSFSDDYSITDKNKDGITIWVNWGRDQATVLDSLIREYFTAETGIGVDLKITNASLLLGMLSGNAPDLSLQLSRTEPLNLAVRGALYDLTQFSDYDEVITRFADGAEIPYTYKSGVYALPDTQSFYLMFYRKDIFERLNLEVPNTWDEYLTTASILQINNLDAYIPYTQITDTTVVNAGVGGLNLYATILQQFGGSFYNDELKECLLNGTVAFNAFKYWTDMYIKKKLPTTASFYNRFRSGTMPLGIDVYTNYTTFAEAAPEIEGRWSIALVPGIEQEDGTINRTISGAGTGCAIIKKSEHIEEAWEFLKWWTSADTQLMYNNNVESIIGAVSRVTTSNIEAFSRMSWGKQDLEILLEQRRHIKEIPEVPGSYFLSRAVDQAFWNVVESNAQPRDTLYKWGNICNSEIKRKIEEYADTDFQ